MADKKDILDDELHWYKDAIIYELHIKAFKDGNGDGMGDFQGLMEKLDYLEDLGVTAIWLLPFYPSPLKDDGYDIADYFTINPTYGDVKQFKKFMAEAHKRGLRVITELVLNHTSDQHPWFQRARTTKPGSPYRDYYVWTDDPSKYKETRIIFKDFEASNWTWDPVAKQYFWHRFYSHQPDLNYDNPRVQAEVFRVIDFWLDMGVDGFRLDAVPYLFERENTNCENLPETHEFLKKLRAHVDSKYTGKLLLAEANMWPEEAAAYFGDADECQMNYHFPIMPRLFMSVKMEDRYPIIDIFDQTPEIPETCQWAMFLRNHDELTLEMVTDEERDYMYRMYTKDPLARINLGIRHRLAPLLDNNRRKIELMNYLLFSLPGTPVIYYGDEIGMGDNYYLGDRNGVRTPMQWNADRNAGFSDANPQKLYLPIILDPEYQYEAVNVETQQKNLSSLLWWMKRVINMRKQYKAFGRGDMKFLSPNNSKIIAFLRTYQDETILVLANLSRFSQAVELDLKEYVEYIPTEIFSQNKFPSVKDEPYLFTVGPHGYFWFLLKKEKVEMAVETDHSKPAVSLKEWDNLFVNRKREILENEILPAYVMKCRWFGGKARKIQKINVLEAVPLQIKDLPASLMIMEVQYTEGSSEMYQLPVAFTKKEQEKKIRDAYNVAIIAPILLKDEQGILFDAVFSEAYRNFLFQMILKRKKLRTATMGEVNFYADKAVETRCTEFSITSNEVTSKVLGAEQSNTSIIYNNCFFFKVYRKIDRIMNPDLEISKFLSEKVHFPNIPKFLGGVEIVQNGSSTALGILQAVVTNQGDVWEYIADSVNRFFERVMTLENPKKVPDKIGDLMNPATFQETPEEFQFLLEGAYVEGLHNLGFRTAEMHIALASRPTEKDFEPESFSLHYQRSLFSSLQSLVRGTFQTLNSTLNNLPEVMKEEAQELLGMRSEILSAFKNVYSRKITAEKIRIHGDYHLGQVLYTGKDFIITDFEGEPARTFGERRLKRSPLRDVAGMIRSFHYAAYHSLIMDDSPIRKEDTECLEKWADQWYHYVSGYFFQSYLERAKGQDFIPSDKEDLNILMQTFLLEKAVYELNYELNNRPKWVLIPIRGIKNIMERYHHAESIK